MSSLYEIDVDSCKATLQTVMDDAPPDADRRWTLARVEVRAYHELFPIEDIGLPHQPQSCLDTDNSYTLADHLVYLS
jgi:hypothetical protein